MFSFAKYVAAGNDFIVSRELPNAIALLCNRREGIGADGLIWLEEDNVHFFNQDGSKAYCCGNGLRVAAVYSGKQRLKTALGWHQVEFYPGGCRVSYPDPSNYHRVFEVEDPCSVFHPPQEVNCNYVKVLNRNHVLLKTIERGVGETPSCGSGAISTFLKLFNYRKVEPKILVEFTSGEKLSVASRDADVWLEGPVRQVFEGKIG